MPGVHKRSAREEPQESSRIAPKWEARRQTAARKQAERKQLTMKRCKHTLANMRTRDILRELRQRKQGRSWRSLAREIGCSAPYLSDVIRGNRKAGPKILRFLKGETQ